MMLQIFDPYHSLISAYCFFRETRYVDFFLFCKRLLKRDNVAPRLRDTRNMIRVHIPL